MKLEFKRLTEVNASEFIALNTNPLVRRQMPLTSEKLDEENCREWIKENEMKLESVTIMFPPTRTRVKGILRLGFQPDGEVEIAGERFIRYRLCAPARHDK